MEIFNQIKAKIMYIARSIPFRNHSDKTATPSESRSLGSGGGKCICYRRIVSSSAVKKKKEKKKAKKTCAS